MSWAPGAGIRSCRPAWKRYGFQGRIPAVTQPLPRGYRVPAHKNTSDSKIPGALSEFHLRTTGFFQGQFFDHASTPAGKESDPAGLTKSSRLYHGPVQNLFRKVHIRIAEQSCEPGKICQPGTLP